MATVTILDNEGGTVIALFLLPYTGLLNHWYKAGLRVYNG